MDKAVKPKRAKPQTIDRTERAARALERLIDAAHEVAKLVKRTPKGRPSGRKAAQRATPPPPDPRKKHSVERNVSAKCR